MDAGEHTAHHLTESLRESARQNGWPEHVATRLEVRHDNHRFTYHWPESVDSEVQRLEYGDASTLPRPVIRPHSNRSQSGSSVLVKHAWESLGGRL